LSVFHVGGDEVLAEGMESTPSCVSKWLQSAASVDAAGGRRNVSVERLKQEFMADVVARAARLGVSVQAWDDAVAGHDEQPRDAERWVGGGSWQSVYINAWNNNRRSNAFSYAAAGYKVSPNPH